ncbi:MAG: nitrous oxide reductase accessory protein NosL [Candidatus Caldarchaeum sp.]
MADEPGPIGRSCSYCGMEIRDLRFAAELIVDNQTLFYDDVGCMMIHYLSHMGIIPPVQNTVKNAEVKRAAVYDYLSSEKVDAKVAWYVKGSSVMTPMRHGVIAFKSFSDALDFGGKFGGEVMGWDAVLKTFTDGEKQEGHQHSEVSDVHNAFNIPLKTLHNNVTTVSEALKRGKPLVLVFFATWCPTCSKNITTLSRAYESMREKVTVFLSSFDPGDTVEKITRFLEQHNAHSDWIVTLPNVDFLVSLRVISQETVFGISVDGSIVYEKRFGTLTEDDWLRIADMLTAG